MFEIDFSFKFLGTRDLITKREIREEQQGKSFLSSLLFIGMVKIYWLKHITSR